MLSGASAGGVAVYFWGNYLGNKLINSKYWLIADSGIALNFANFQNNQYELKESYAALFKLSNR